MLDATTPSALDVERKRQEYEAGQVGSTLGQAGSHHVSLTHARELTPEVSAMVDDMFVYHEWNYEQQTSGSLVRTALADAVKLIIDNVPPSPDRSAAIRKLREARMDCNSAITHHGKY